MRLLDFLGRAVMAPGAIVNEALGSARRGQVMPSRISVTGNATQAKVALCRAGIDAWGQTQLNGNLGAVTVKPQDRQHAVSALQAAGWEAW